MAGKHEIVFEDLHGEPDESSVQVDIDEKDRGITRSPAPQPAPVDDEDRDDEGSALQNQPAASDGEDDEEEGGKAYSEKVRKRIERERRAKQKVTEERDYWKTQAEESQKKLQETRKGVTKQTLESIDRQLEQVQADLERAIEDGKTSEQVKLTAKMTDLKAERITSQLGGDDSGDTEPEGGKVQPQTGKVSLAKKWMDDRSDWYGKKGFERQTRLANRIDKEVYADGFDVNDPEYFEELDRRLKEKAPELFDDDGGEREDKRQRRSPVASVDGDGGVTTRASTGNKVELTKDDFATMRRFNLNTNDPEVLKEFARNKREAESEQRRRTGGQR